MVRMLDDPPTPSIMNRCWVWRMVWGVAFHCKDPLYKASGLSFPRLPPVIGQVPSAIGSNRNLWPLPKHPRPDPILFLTKPAKPNSGGSKPHIGSHSLGALNTPKKLYHTHQGQVV